MYGFSVQSSLSMQQRVGNFNMIVTSRTIGYPTSDNGYVRHEIYCIVCKTIHVLYLYLKNWDVGPRPDQALWWFHSFLTTFTPAVVDHIAIVLKCSDMGIWQARQVAVLWFYWYSGLSLIYCSEPFLYYVYCWLNESTNVHNSHRMCCLLGSAKVNDFANLQPLSVEQSQLAELASYTSPSSTVQWMWEIDG